MQRIVRLYLTLHAGDDGLTWNRISGPHDVLVLERDNTAWGGRGLDIAVHFVPTFQYTVSGMKTGWTRTPLVPLVEKQPGYTWEVVEPRGHEWFYYGTYRCAQFSSVQSDIDDPKYDMVSRL